MFRKEHDAGAHELEKALWLAKWNQFRADCHWRGGWWNSEDLWDVPDDSKQVGEASSSQWPSLAARKHSSRFQDVFLFRGKIKQWFSNEHSGKESQMEDAFLEGEKRSYLAFSSCFLQRVNRRVWRIVICQALKYVYVFWGGNASLGPVRISSYSRGMCRGAVAIQEHKLYAVGWRKE